MILKFLYTLFIGILFAILVGVGITAFYAAPKEPQYPSALKIERPGTLTEPVFLELKKEQETYDTAFTTYQTKMQAYNKNVSLIAIVFAITTLFISLTVLKNLSFISDGFLLGGILSLVYAIFVGFGAGNDTFRFIVVCIGFLVSIILGYIKLMQPTGEGSKKL